MAKKPAIRTRHDRRATHHPAIAAVSLTPAASELADAALAATTPGGEIFRPTLCGEIRPDPNNPRKLFDAEGLAELAASIVRDGLLEPLVIRPVDGDTGFMLIAGERRWRAICRASEAGDWPADRPIPAMVREVTEQDARRLALVENLQRRDLNAVEEARALSQLAELTGASAAQIGRDLGFTERWAQQRLSLLKLPESMQHQVETGAITVQDGREAVSLLPKLPAIKQVELREGKITVAAAKAWAASRPQPLELEAADTLALLELAWALSATRSAGRYTDTPVDYRYRKAPLFNGASLWTVNRSYSDGRDRGVVGFAGWDHLRAITGSDAPLVRELLEPHVRKARVAALAGNPLAADYDPEAFKKVDALYKAKRHVTEWLNTPFQVDPAWQAERAETERQNRERAEGYSRERAAEDAERERERAEKAAAIETERQAGRDLLNRVLGLEGTPWKLDETLAERGFVGPFRVQDIDDQPTIVDAEGKAWTAFGCGLEALRRIMALCLNITLGLEATSGPPIEDAPWRREATPPAPLVEDDSDDEPMVRGEFERAVANCLADDLEISDAEAARLASRGIDAQLGREVHGHDEIAWTFDGAMALAEKIRVDGLGQQVDLEEAIAAHAAEDVEAETSPALLALAGVPAGAAS